MLDKSLSKDYAKVYYDPETQRAVVVHRGTSGAADWLNNVAYYVFGQYEKTNRYKTGKKYKKKPKLKIVLLYYNCAPDNVGYTEQ